MICLCMCAFLLVAGLGYEMKCLPSSLLADPCVVHALAVREAWASSNYCRFFRLYQTTSHMGSYLLDLFLPRERLAAVRAMVKTYVCSALYCSPPPLPSLSRRYVEIFNVLCGACSGILYRFGSGYAASTN